MNDFLKFVTLTQPPTRTGTNQCQGGLYRGIGGTDGTDGLYRSATTTQKNAREEEGRRRREEKGQGTQDSPDANDLSARYNFGKGDIGLVMGEEKKQGKAQRLTKRDLSARDDSGKGGMGADAKRQLAQVIQDKDQVIAELKEKLEDSVEEIIKKLDIMKG